MTNESSNVRIGFIGAGRMATALVAGFCREGGIASANILACDLSEHAQQAFHSTTGAECCDSIPKVVEHAEILFLAVKPQHLKSASAKVVQKLTPGQTVVSIAAGVTIAQLSDMLGGHQQLIRVMPNTPALVGAGASAISATSSVPTERVELLESLLSSVGLVVSVPENLMDAVTGLSGSGPAYVFQFIEALSDGGVQVGLPRATATKLAAQTVLGAAKMVLETGEHPGQLKDGVTSPGGTTIAAIATLERAGFRSAAIDAVQASTDRSKELAKSQD